MKILAAGAATLGEIGMRDASTARNNIEFIAAGAATAFRVCSSFGEKYENTRRR